jgi:hypothetical protein
MKKFGFSIIFLFSLLVFFAFQAENPLKKTEWNLVNARDSSDKPLKISGNYQFNFKTKKILEISINGNQCIDAFYNLGYDNRINLSGDMSLNVECTNNELTTFTNLIQQKGQYVLQDNVLNIYFLNGASIMLRRS